MSASDYHIELFDQFLEGVLSEKEHENFLYRIEKDSEFKKSFELHKQIINSFEEDGNKDLKNFLVGLENENIIDNPTTIQQPDSTAKKLVNNPTAKVFKLNRMIPAIAAGLVLLFGALFLFNSGNIETDLFGQYYSSYPNDLTRIERSENIMTPIEKTMLSYSKKEYRAFTNQVDNLISTSESIDLKNELLYFKGIALMETNQFQEAITILDKLSKGSEFEYSPQVNWYLALCHLKEGDSAKAKSLLQNFKGDYKNQEIKNLLFSLEKENSE
jgi:hypothetical protein